MSNTAEQQPTTKAKAPPEKRLGFIFDIDGTLIAEGGNIRGIRHRPGVVEFLDWLTKERGHAVALWTAAWSGHADQVATNLCLAVQGDGHQCRGGRCRQTFDFVWDVHKLRVQRQVKPNSNGELDYGLDGCRWCQMYSTRCNRCCCFSGPAYCPCRSTKDLGKVWHCQDDVTARFVKERTLIVENTPQQCIWNYGNAIYVPTYRGHQSSDEQELFQRLKLFVLQLEEAENVRTHRKCSHRPGPHACFEQDWWSYPISPQCVEIPAVEKEPQKCEFKGDLTTASAPPPLEMDVV